MEAADERVSFCSTDIDLTTVMNRVLRDEGLSGRLRGKVRPRKLYITPENIQDMGSVSSCLLIIQTRKYILQKC